jgi:hypothetical protein
VTKLEISTASSPTTTAKPVQYGYRFNFITGQWAIIDTNFQSSDIKFDKLGNMYLLDLQGNIFSAQNKGLVIYAGVKDFEVNVRL